MTTNTTTRKTQLTQAEFDALTIQVQETLATSITFSREKKFTTVDLWAIQRRKRRAAVRYADSGFVYAPFPSN